MRGPRPDRDVLLGRAGDPIAIGAVSVPLAVDLNKEVRIRGKVRSRKAEPGGDVIVSVLPLELVEDP